MKCSMAWGQCRGSAYSNASLIVENEEDPGASNEIAQLMTQCPWIKKNLDICWWLLVCLWGLKCFTSTRKGSWISWNLFSTKKAHFKTMKSNARKIKNTKQGNVRAMKQYKKGNKMQWTFCYILLNADRLCNSKKNVWGAFYCKCQFLTFICFLSWEMFYH